MSLPEWAWWIQVLTANLGELEPASKTLCSMSTSPNGSVGPHLGLRLADCTVDLGDTGSLEVTEASLGLEV